MAIARYVRQRNDASPRLQEEDLSNTMTGQARGRQAQDWYYSRARGACPPRRGLSRDHNRYLLGQRPVATYEASGFWALSCLAESGELKLFGERRQRHQRHRGGALERPATINRINKQKPTRLILIGRRSMAGITKTKQAENRTRRVEMISVRICPRPPG